MQATPADAAIVATIHAACFGNPWGEADFQRFLEDAHSGCLLAQFTGSAAGFLLWRKVGDEAEIITFAVRPEHRRRRLGFMLVDGMKQLLLDCGVRRCFLEVSQDNIAAISLYRSAAFLDVGIRKGYYSVQEGKNADALVMQCNL